METSGERPDFTPVPASAPSPIHSNTPPPGSNTPPPGSSIPPRPPYGEARVFEPRKSRKGFLAGLVAVAFLSAGVGGVAGVTAGNYFDTPEALAPPATSAEIPASSGSDVAAVDWQATADAVQSAVVSIQVATSSGSGQGSGVIIDTDGTIVTNDHVIAGQDASISVIIGSNIYPATTVGTDPSTDLAVIRITDPPADLQAVTFADSATLDVGQPVMAVGNPLGLSGTATTGIISALNRPVTTQQSGQGDTTDGTVVTAAIQTSAAINPGNSGGALVNTAGELVGITSSIATIPSTGGSSGNIGIGFAIPSNQVSNIVDQLLSDGTVRHAQLGVTARAAVAGNQLGAEVVQVTGGSAANEAGLRAGDVITAVDGVPTGTSEALVAMIRNARVGQEVTVTYIRGSEENTTTATLDAATA